MAASGVFTISDDSGAQATEMIAIAATTVAVRANKLTPENLATLHIT
jgi:hypothetical protein